MAAALIFPTIFSFIALTVSAIITNAAGDGFAVRLIHRDSPLSPLYNSSMTAFDRIQASAYRSFARLNHIHSLTSTSPFSSPDEQDISSTLVPDNQEYIATFSIGTPSTKVHAFIDTGSEVIWVKCRAGSPVFDPEKSSSIRYYLCNSPTCYTLVDHTCEKKAFAEPCYYKIAYVDTTSTRGTLSRDNFLFEDPNGNPVDVGHLDFGCSNQWSPEFQGLQDGALGLSRGPLSLISQLGIKKFSYCMVLPDNEGSESRMYFGSSAVISGGQTPFDEDEKDYYYVTLIGISIGEKMLALPDGIFNRTSDGDGGFFVDSGTYYSMLRSEAYDVLIQALAEAISLPRRKGPREYFELCFEASFEDLDSAGAGITFLFDGAQVILMTQTTYHEVQPGNWCLAILRANEKLSTLGNFQQRNYFVGYDLEEGVVSFAPVDCATF